MFSRLIVKFSFVVIFAVPSLVNNKSPDAVIWFTLINGVPDKPVAVPTNDPAKVVVATIVGAVIEPEAIKLPVIWCVSSDELPNIVDPEDTLVILSDTMYDWAIRVPEIITLFSLNSIGSKLPVPSNTLVPSVWTTLW